MCRSCEAAVACKRWSMRRQMCLYHAISRAGLLLNGGAAVRVRKVGRGVAVSWIRVDGHGKKAEHHRWPDQTNGAVQGTPCPP